MSFNFPFKKLAFVAFALARDKPEWYNLKTHFSLLPLTGFYDEPRTLDKATEEGFQKYGDGCEENHMLPGYHYVQVVDGQIGEMALIFDKNGYIAGMRSIVPKSKMPDEKYLNEYYMAENILGSQEVLIIVWLINGEPKVHSCNLIFLELCGHCILRTPGDSLFRSNCRRVQKSRDRKWSMVCQWTERKFFVGGPAFC